MLRIAARIPANRVLIYLLECIVMSIDKVSSTP
jgi:hypothetical protein